MFKPQNPFSNKNSRVPDITHDTQQKAADELSSGYRRNLIKKYIPDSSISANFQEQLDTINHAIAQAKAELSIVQTKDNALAKIQDLLVQLRKLAVLAKQPSLTKRDRVAINAKSKQLQNEIDRISFTIRKGSF
jgi:flagellin-like hook-associated protein FlgL